MDPSAHLIEEKTPSFMRSPDHSFWSNPKKFIDEAPKLIDLIVLVFFYLSHFNVTDQTIIKSQKLKIVSPQSLNVKEIEPTNEPETETQTKTYLIDINEHLEILHLLLGFIIKTEHIDKFEKVLFSVVMGGKTSHTLLERINSNKQIYFFCKGLPISLVQSKYHICYLKVKFIYKTEIELSSEITTILNSIHFIGANLYAPYVTALMYHASIYFGYDNEITYFIKYTSGMSMVDHFCIYNKTRRNNIINKLNFGTKFYGLEIWTRDQLQEIVNIALSCEHLTKINKKYSPELSFQEFLSSRSIYPT